MSMLIPCPDCSRHVRATEPSCPFCGSALPAGGSVLRAAPQVAGLGRAAIMAFGAAAAITVTGCGDDGGTGTGDGGRADAQVVRDGTIGNFDAAYGGPPFDAGEEDATIGAPDAAYGGPPDATIAPPYGTPPDDDGGAPAPAYGAPPP